MTGVWLYYVPLVAAVHCSPLLPSDHTLLWCWEYLDSPWKGEESLETSTRRDEANRQPNKLSCRFGTVPTSKAAQPPWQPAAIQAMMVIEPRQLNWLRHWRYLARRLGFQAQLGWIHSRQPQHQLCWMPMHRLDCSCTPRHSQLWSHLRLGERGLASSRTQIVVYFHSFMFKLSGLVNRTSAVAEAIYVDVLSGTCTVKYNDGTMYDYTNVSRRALFNVLNNENASLGFFINNSLKFVDSKCARYGTAKQWVSYAVW